MSMDGFGTPQDILATQTSEQFSHFLADGWTASFPSRFPAPPLLKGMLMPQEHRLGFHQLVKGELTAHGYHLTSH
jgi:hypothetical protein